MRSHPAATAHNRNCRFASSEAAYEAYHAAVGLLALWHQNVIDEDTLPVRRPTASTLLDALQQVRSGDIRRKLMRRCIFSSARGPCKKSPAWHSTAVPLALGRSERAEP